MDVRLPDGTVISNVPDGMSRSDLLKRLKSNGFDISKLLGVPSAEDERKRLQAESADEAGPLAAGVGRGMTNVAKGVGQSIGMVSRQDVKDSRALDAGLMDTAGGKWGNVVGTAAPLALTALVPGVGTYAGATGVGALTGLLAPSASTGETAINTLTGAAAGPAGVLLGRGVGAAWSGLRGLLEPFTKAGQDRVAAGVLQRFATDPKSAAAAAANAKELVPGSSPTLAQATGDAGLAQLERSLASTPTAGPQLAARGAAQRAARLKAVQDVAGTDEYYQGIKQGLQTFAAEDYGKAMSQGIDRGMADALSPQIKSLLERPSIQMAKREAISLAKESGISIKDFGSIEGLDWLKKGLDNLISKAKAPGNSIGDAKLRAIVQTKQDLMSVIEDIAPAYKSANDNYMQMARQVNAMDAARDVLKRMQSPLGRSGASTSELRNEYARALEAATESVRRSTGMDLPLSRVMPQRDVDALKAVASDMARATTAENLGRAVGSNTIQNTAAQNLLRRTMGPMGMPQKWSESNVLQAFLSPYTAVAKLGGAETEVMNRVTQAMLEPGGAAKLLLEAQKPSGSVAREALKYMPALAVSNSPKQ